MQKIEKKQFENVQYIRLVKDLQFEDRKGRYTILSCGLPGFILDEMNIDDIYDLTEKQRKACLEMLSIAQKSNGILALIQGYPCVINQSDFEISEPPKTYPVIGEIV